MNVKEFERLLENLEQRYQNWVKPINEFISERLYQVNRGGYTYSDYERDLRAFRKERLAEYNPFAEMSEMLETLCPAYLEATAWERSEIRAAAGGKAGVLSALLGHAYRAAEEIESASDGERLRMGLAALSIENCAKDYRDVLLALAELYLAAERAGIDPKPEFRAVAKLSSKEKPVGGTTSVSRMLGSFSKSAVLRERRRKDKAKEKQR
jgi:hypothetical protein